jgi:hypothetical protein
MTRCSNNVIDAYTHAERHSHELSRRRHGIIDVINMGVVEFYLQKVDFG